MHWGTAAGAVSGHIDNHFGIGIGIGIRDWAARSSSTALCFDSIQSDAIRFSRRLFTWRTLNKQKKEEEQEQRERWGERSETRTWTWTRTLVNSAWDSVSRCDWPRNVEPGVLARVTEPDSRTRCSASASVDVAASAASTSP